MITSILIPAHQEETTIGRCLSSLLMQAEPAEFHVIVAANGCTDNTAEVARTFPGVEVIELADKFAEAYQGKYGLIGPISLMSAKKTNNIVEFLEGQVDELEEMRYKVVDKDCTPIQNIIDEIFGLYYATLYKLKFLA